MREIVGAVEDCEVVGLARDGQETIQMAMQSVPHVALIAYDLPGIAGPQTCETLNALAPDIMSVLVSDSRSNDKIEAAMRAGARALIARPLQRRDVEKLIGELAEVRKRADSPEVSDWKDPARFPRVIAVTGAKGGVGKSTIAVNLAVMLAKKSPKKVAVLDLYTQFGDIGTMFGLVPKRTLSELVPITTELDPDLIRNYVTEHESGVDVIASSSKPLPLDAIGTESLDNLFYVLKRMYRYVIVDMPPMLHPMTLHVMAHSNLILLVANLFDVTTATDTKRYYDALVEERIPRGNVRVVLNRVSKVNRLHTGDMERMLDVTILAHIPNDGRLVSAVNQGVPMAMSDGDSPLGHSLERLAGAVSGQTPDVPHVEREPAKRRRIFKAK